MSFLCGNTSFDLGGGAIYQGKYDIHTNGEAVILLPDYMLNKRVKIVSTTILNFSNTMVTSPALWMTRAFNASGVYDGGHLQLSPYIGRRGIIITPPYTDKRTYDATTLNKNLELVQYWTGSGKAPSGWIKSSSFHNQYDVSISIYFN